MFFRCPLHKGHRVGRKYIEPNLKILNFFAGINNSILDKLKTSKFLEKIDLDSYSRGLKMLIWSLLLLRSRFYEAKTGIFSIDLPSTAQYCANKLYIFWITVILAFKKIGFLVRENMGTQMRVKKLKAHFHVLCTTCP